MVPRYLDVLLVSCYESIAIVYVCSADDVKKHLRTSKEQCNNVTLLLSSASEEH